MSKRKCSDPKEIAVAVYLKKHGYATTEDIAKATGLTVEEARVVLASLQWKGMVGHNEYVEITQIFTADDLIRALTRLRRAMTGKK